MKLAKTIGEIIRADRKATGSSLEQLAKKVGVGVATLQRIETGTTSPSLDLLQKIALEIHRPIASFFQKGDADVDHRKSEDIELIKKEKFFFKVVSPYGLIHPKIFIAHFKGEAGTSYDTENEGYMGGYIWVYLLQGKLVVEYRNKIHAINKDDVFFSSGRRPQVVKALADAEFLFALTKEKENNFVRVDEPVSVKRNMREIIRADRKAMGLSLEQLAKKIGIGVATLHRIETGATSPSLDLLLKIAQEIHRPITSFFQKGDTDVDHRKSEEMELIEKENYSFKLIAPYGLIHPEVVIWDVKAKAGFYERQQQSRYEWIYLLKGQVVVDYEGKIYAVNEGDVFLYDCRKPHEVTIVEDSEFIYAFRKIQ